MSNPIFPYKVNPSSQFTPYWPSTSIALTKLNLSYTRISSFRQSTIYCRRSQHLTMKTSTLVTGWWGLIIFAGNRYVILVTVSMHLDTTLSRRLRRMWQICWQNSDLTVLPLTITCEYTTFIYQHSNTVEFNSFDVNPKVHYSFLVFKI